MSVSLLHRDSSKQNCLSQKTVCNWKKSCHGHNKTVEILVQKQFKTKEQFVNFKSKQYNLDVHFNTSVNV